MAIAYALAQQLDHHHLHQRQAELSDRNKYSQW